MFSNYHDELLNDYIYIVYNFITESETKRFDFNDINKLHIVISLQKQWKLGKSRYRKKRWWKPGGIIVNIEKIEGDTYIHDTYTLDSITNSAFTQ